MRVVLVDRGRERRRRQYQALKERYRARIAQRPAQTSDPGAGEDLLREMDELADVRRHATQKLDEG